MVLFICKLLLIADIIITTMSVIGRYVPFIPDPAWSEEVVLTCMSYMAVLSAALAIRRGAHIRMTAFDVYLPKIVVKVLDILADLAVCVLGIIMLVVGWNYATTLGGRGFYVSMPWLSRFWMYFPVPLAGVAMVIFEIEALYNHIKSFFVKEECNMTGQTLAIIVLLVSFFVMIFLRFPIAYAVGLSSVLCMMVQGQALTDVCRLMVKGISSFSLMAVSVLHHHGRAHGLRRHLRKADRAG